MTWDDPPQRSSGGRERSRGGSNGGFGRNDGGGPPQARQLGADDKPYKWASSRKRYEWKEEAEDDGVSPPDLELEKELFGDENHVNSGINFAKYEKIKVKVKGEGSPPPINSFDEANLHPVMKENVRLAQYVVPTPVQKYSIPIITSGFDLLACAQTGSGKTAAFLIPILSQLFGKARELAAPRPKSTFEARRYKAQPLVLILAPTRELCSQIFDECRRFTYRSMLRPCAIYGGAESMPQKIELEKGCDILAATPGRLCDFLQREKVVLHKIKYLILDEADRMLDMGFEASIRQIVERSEMPPPLQRQTQMFSATFPRSIRKLAQDFLKEKYLFLKVGRVGGTTTDISQKVEFVEEVEKREKLRLLLLSQPPSRTLIFVETKRGADSLDQFLYDQHFPSTSIHGDRTQMEREDALLAFKNGKCPILVATAVAARGLDIRNIMHVVNYDLCNDIDEYVHRIGRTARVGNQGLATTFYNDKNQSIAPELTKLLIECNQVVPDFLESYRTTDLRFEEDEDDDDVPAPDYAGSGGRGSAYDGGSGGYAGDGYAGDNSGYGNDRGNDRGGYGGDHGGYGGSRGGHGGNRGGHGGDRDGYGGDRGNDRGGYGGDRSDWGGYGGDRGSERSGYGGDRGDRGGYGGDRGSDRGGYGGDRGDRGGYGGDRGSDRGGYGGDRSDRGGYNGDRGSDRGGYGGDRGGERGGYGSERGGYGGERGGYGGERGGYGSDRGDRDRGGYGGDRGDRDRGGYGGDRGSDRSGYGGSDRGGGRGGDRGGYAGDRGGGYAGHRGGRDRNSSDRGSGYAGDNGSGYAGNNGSGYAGDQSGGGGGLDIPWATSPSNGNDLNWNAPNIDSLSLNDKAEKENNGWGEPDKPSNDSGNRWEDKPNDKPNNNANNANTGSFNQWNASSVQLLGNEKLGNENRDWNGGSNAGRSESSRSKSPNPRFNNQRDGSSGRGQDNRGRSPGDRRNDGFNDERRSRGGSTIRNVDEFGTTNTNINTNNGLLAPSVSSGNGSSGPAVESEPACAPVPAQNNWDTPLPVESNMAWTPESYGWDP